MSCESHALEGFARRIGQIPIRLTREHSSYVFSALLNAVLRSALSMVASGVASFETVDRAWWVS